MKYDLSSKITLERTPEHYYRSNDMVESLRQTRYEKLPTKIFSKSNDGTKFIAQNIASLIREKAKLGQRCVLGLSGGLSP